FKEKEWILKTRKQLIKRGIKIKMKRVGIILIGLFTVMLAACGGDSEAEGTIDEIVFADAGWDSIRVHNYIARTIIEEGFGYETDETTGSTAATIQGLRDGDIHA